MLLSAGNLNPAIGYLVDASVEPIFLSYPSPSFIVPQNKLFVLLGSTSGCLINGFTVNSVENPIVVLAGDSVDLYGGSTHYGYLVDENYFAGCGGGGSSSASAGLDSATVATMIANAGPTFISPINILNYYCNGADTLIINIDSLLYQHPSSIILHVEANILGANAGWNVLELKSYNGLFETPVCHWHRQQSGIYNNTYHNFTTQVTIAMTTLQ